MMYPTDNPRVAITLGDPAGVGPEVIVAAWSDPRVHAICRPLVVGQPEWLTRAAALWGLPLNVVPITHPDQIAADPETIPCLTAGPAAALDEVVPGAIHPLAGESAYQALMAATDLALAGEVDAICTAPLCKQSLHAAGHRFPGHTELLAHRCGVPEVAMMLYLAPDERIKSPAGLGVVHVTLHVALREIWQQLTEENILAKAHLVNEIMGRLKGQPPRIGVSSLNPHAGEGGLFGDEEQSIITPAVERGRRAGLLLEGPLPNDTLFVDARDGRFDGVVAMYHDQGHIALKLLGFQRAVNITLGLPIVRTSVAHGTAFDLAWQGRAECGSLIEALRVASLLARTRSENLLR